MFAAVDNRDLANEFLPLFRLVVIVGTRFGFRTRLRGLARLRAIDIRVVFQFFPAMAEGACRAVRASDFIVGDEGIRVPGRARFRVVIRGVNDARPASIVLPIMRVHAHATIMIDVVEGTPDRFIEEDIEIDIVRVVVNELNVNVGFGVGERAEDAVLARLAIVRVLRAEFRLVLVWAVQLFDFVVAFRAVVARGTSIPELLDETASVRGIGSPDAPTILQSVIVLALLVIVLDAHARATLDLEFA